MTHEEVQIELDLRNRFTYHPPTDKQVGSYRYLRGMGLQAARDIVALCPACPERDTAIRKMEEVVMWANASIARSGHGDAG